MCINMCVCEIPSFHPECVLSRVHLLLLLLSCQINQWIATQDILHANPLLLCLLLSLLKWQKKQFHSTQRVNICPLSNHSFVDCALSRSEIIIYFAFLLFSPLLPDLLQFCHKSCSVIVIAVLLRVLVLIILQTIKHRWQGSLMNANHN